MYTSLLFVPGDSERKIEKSADAPADVIILDLEDAVAAPMKTAARELTAATLRSRRHRQKLYVRVNALDTGWTQADLDAVMAAGPDGLVLPKCNGPQDVVRLSDMAASVHPASEAGIIAIVTETAEGVLSLTRGGWAVARLEAMMWGAEDLAADIGAFRNYEDGNYAPPFLAARQLCLLAARAAGVSPIDTVYADFKDMQGLARHARAACLDGFDAKAAIHPGQLPVITAAFAPTADQITWAEAVQEAFADAEAGVANLNGRMLDLPHLRMARRILARRING